MSHTGTNILRQQRRRASASTPSVLPQWSIDLFRRVVWKLSRLLWRINFKGVEHIPAAGGIIIAANHQTYIDPFWVGAQIKRPVRFLAWSKIFTWPVLGSCAGLLGAWPLLVEGSDPKAIRLALSWLREGGAVMIFPEGGRGLPSGAMIRFKAGAARMALEANVPILPVTIRGGHRVWPSNRTFPRLAKIEVRYHPLYHAHARVDEDTRSAARRVTADIQHIIGESLK